ncbi:MAG TPA: PIN domain-containing protein [Methylomirabilota bacterium]|nr:PIN domain-containing protein [Methylomirabilota bacterium]
MIVADANVLVRALSSRNGASHWIVRGMLTGEVPFALSPAVVIEYEDVLSRPGILGSSPWVRADEIATILDTLCAVCVPALPWFRFRPFLADPKDDLYVECALAAGARLVVSHDRHFRNPAMAAFGLRVSTAVEFEAEWRTRSMPT